MVLGTDPDAWGLDDLDPISKRDRKHYAEAVRVVPLDLSLLAADGSGSQVLATVGGEFSLGGAVVHVDLDDMAARVIAPDTDSFLVAARSLENSRHYWHWLNELVATNMGSWQPDYRSIELAAGLSRKRSVASSLLISLRRKMSKRFLSACLDSQYVEIAERALEEAVRRRIPDLSSLVEPLGNHPRSNIASAAKRYLREATE